MDLLPTVILYTLFTLIALYLLICAENNALYKKKQTNIENVQSKLNKKTENSPHAISRTKNSVYAIVLLSNNFHGASMLTFTLLLEREFSFDNFLFVSFKCLRNLIFFKVFFACIHLFCSFIC